MSSRSRQQSVTPAPQRTETPKKETPAVQDNSEVLDEMKATGNDFELGRLAPRNVYGWETDGSKIEEPGVSRKTDDSFGDGIQRVQREREVVGTKKVKNKGPGYRTQKKRETVTTVDNAGFSEGNFNAGRSQTREKRNGTKITNFGGVNVDVSDPLSSTATAGRTTTARDGTSRSHAVSANKDGVSYAYGRSGEKGGWGVNGGVGDNEVRLGVTGSRNIGKNSKIGGGLAGGLIMDRDHTSMIGDVSEAKGLDSFAADVVNWGNRDQEGNPQHTPLMVHGYDNGHQISANLAIQAGVVGVKGHANHSKQTSTNFHTTNRDIDPSIMSKIGGRGVDTSDLPTLAVKNPGLYKKYMAEAFGDRTLAKDGDRASNLHELDVDGLQPGEGFSLQTNSAAGGGGGVSVYGIGGSMHGSKAQTQRTIVHKNTDGSTTFDISTADTATLGGDIEAGGGIANVGMSGTWGDAAKMRFTFEDTKEGRKAMEEFQKTGVLPGAMDEKNPMFERYQELASKGMENLSPTEKADLNTMAEAVNSQMMKADPTKEGFKSVPGVKYEQHKKGEHSSTEYHAGLFGLNMFGSSTTRTSEVMRYSENGEQLLNYRDTFNKDYWFDAADKGYVNVNRPGSNELSLDAQYDMTDEERKRIYALDGKGMPDWSIFGGYDGSKDRVSFNLNKSDIPILAEHGDNLPYWSAGRSFKQTLQSRESMEEQLNSPVSDTAVAQKMLRQQVSEQYHSEMFQQAAEYQKLLGNGGPSILPGPQGSTPMYPQLLDGFGQKNRTSGTDLLGLPRRSERFGMPGGHPSEIFLNQNPFGPGGRFQKQMEEQRAMQAHHNEQINQRMLEESLKIQQSGGMEKWLKEQNPEQVMETVRGIRADQMRDYARIMNQGGNNPHLEQLAETMTGNDFRALPTELQEMYFREVPNFGRNQVNLLRSDKIRRDAFIYQQLKGGDPKAITRFVEDLKPDADDSPVLRQWYRNRIYVGRE